MDGLYGVMVVVGPVLLAAVILYAVVSNRRKNSPAEVARTERATKELREELDREDKSRAHSTAQPVSHGDNPGALDGAAKGHRARPNISTEHQPIGGAQHPRDTLDREPDRDPLSQGAIPSNYDPTTSKRKGEAQTAADAEAARVARNGRE